mmetsp:Transcript_82531/g.260591  ORF Transcript_82531/g.260591 Transcript_82531/m.260591 type:complete len:368 (-) Transcript_82531:40-1143(-)
MASGAEEERPSRRSERASLVPPRQELGRAHAGHLPDAAVLLPVAVAEVLAEQLEVPRVELLHETARLAVEVRCPDIRTAVDVEDVRGLDLEVRVAMLDKHLVHRRGEGAVVDRQRYAVGALEELGLRDEGAALSEGVVHREEVLHHLLHRAVDVARLRELRVGAPVAFVTAAEEGHQPLVGVPQQAKDGLVAKVLLSQAPRPVLLGRVVHGAAGDRARHLQVRVQVAPDRAVLAGHAVCLLPAGLPRHPADASEGREVAGHLDGAQVAGAKHADALDGVAKVVGYVHQGQVALARDPSRGRTVGPVCPRLQEAHAAVVPHVTGQRSVAEGAARRRLRQPQESRKSSHTGPRPHGTRRGGRRAGPATL